MDYYESPQFHKLLWSKVLMVVQLVVSTFLGVTLVFPVLFVFVALNELIRGFVKLGLWYFYRGDIILSPDTFGSNYANFNKENQRMVLYMAEVEGRVDVGYIREKYLERVVGNEIYSKLKYIWTQHWLYICLKKVANFDISNHVRLYPGTEVRAVTEKEVMEVILPDLSSDMTDDKPQWEEVIIPNYHPDPEVPCPPKSLRIIRMHHSYMDGASTLIMIANCISDEKEAFPYVIDPCKPLKISKMFKFFYNLTCVSLFGWYAIWNLVSPPCTRKTRFSIKQYSDRKLHNWTKPIPMESFKSIKEKSGVGMPAIISTVIGGAVRSLELQYPSKSNVRTAGAGHQVPAVTPLWIVAGMFPYAKNNPCNNHTCFETQMTTSDVSGCERLTALNDDLGRSARNPKVTIYWWFTYFIGRTPAPIGKIFLNMTAVDILLSNVPLSTKPVTLCGAKSSSFSGWVPCIGGAGVGIVSVRYADHFRYCVKADSSVMNQEELDYFVSQLELHVEELYLETMNLKRKISSDTSLFEREKADGAVRRSGGAAEVENEHGDNTACEIRNNNNNNNNSASSNYTPTNYSFLSKFKDSLEQIKDGIRKIKEQ